MVLLIDYYSYKDEKKYYIINSDKNFFSLKFSDLFLELLFDNDRSLLNNIKLKWIFFNFSRKLKKMKPENMCLLFSKKIDNNLKYKALINQNLASIFSREIYEIKSVNNMEENIDKYFDNYILKYDLKRQDIKILYILDSVNDLIYNNILKNVNIYKYIDICYIGDKLNFSYIDFKKNIEKLNIDLGSTIDFVDIGYNLNYNIYINFSSRYDLKLKYCIPSTCLYVNWYEEDADIYNKNLKCFNEKSYYIEKEMLSVKCDMKCFSKNKLGALINNKIVNF